MLTTGTARFETAIQGASGHRMAVFCGLEGEKRANGSCSAWGEGRDEA